MDAKKIDELLKDVDMNKAYKGNLVRYFKEHCTDK